MYPEFSSAITVGMYSQEYNLLIDTISLTEACVKDARRSQNSGTGFQGQSGETGIISISLLK